MKEELHVERDGVIRLEYCRLVLELENALEMQSDELFRQLQRRENRVGLFLIFYLSL